MSVSRTVLAAKNLERRNEIGAFHGRIAIGILIIQDLVAVAVLGFTGGNTLSAWSFALIGIPLVRPLLIRLITMNIDEELRLLFGLLLALGGAKLFEIAGLSSELGAIIAGMLIAGNDEAEELSKKMWGLKEIFLVGFFLEVGLAGVPSMQGWYLIGAALLVLPLKIVLFFLLMVAFKLRSRTSYLATVSLTSFSEFALIAGTVAVSTGYLPEGTVVACAILAAISFAINAPLSTYEEKVWLTMEKLLLRLERPGKHPDKQTISLGAANFLVIGMGNAGIAAYDRLKKANQKVVGMDIDPFRIERNIKEGRRVVYGDMQDDELWENLDMSHLNAMMMAIGTPQAKVNATKLIREKGFTGLIYALTMADEEHKALKEAGANAVCLPIKEAGQKLAEFSMSGEEQEEGYSVGIRTA